MSAVWTIRSTASDHFRRWFISFNLQTGSWCIDRTGCARQFDAVSGLADIGGTQIEGLACREDFDRIEILTAECFYARDVPAACGYEFLNKRRLINTEIDR